MAVCRHCSRNVKDTSNFCPYCGRKLEAGEPIPAAAPERKKLSKKTVALIALLLMAVIAVGTVISWEVKIDRARSLYNQAEYWDAHREIKYVPALGREEVYRYKVAWLAGDLYESYLVNKPNITKGSEYACREGFWELTFGLYIDLRDVQEDWLNDIQVDEYEKFIEIYYDELRDTFSMSREEADRLMEAMEAADEVKDMKELANQWLEDNFF